MIMLTVKRYVSVGLNHSREYGLSFYINAYRIGWHRYLVFTTHGSDYSVLKEDHALFDYRPIHRDNPASDQGHGLLLGE